MHKICEFNNMWIIPPNYFAGSDVVNFHRLIPVISDR